MGTCGVCGIAISVSETLYTADAKPVCQGCYDKQPAPRDPGTRSPAAIVLAIGAVIALVPFVMSSSSSSVETVNGEVVSSTYRDWFAIAGGVTAVACALVGAVMALRLRAFALVGGAALVVALGGYHVARGFGVFHKPSDADSTVGIEIKTTPVPEPVVRPAKDPATCPDANTCDNIAGLIKNTDAAGALVAHTRACTFGQQYDCTRVGRAWMHGDSGASGKDLAKALTYLMKGCELADGDACTDAGVMYLIGEGATKDEARGRTLLDKACDAGTLLGCKNLVAVYLEGHGVAVDRAKAFGYAVRACGDGGYDLADATAIGWACDVAGEALLKGQGTKADAKAAFGYFEKACERAPSHCFNLGVVVADGTGTKKNEKLARELYAKACETADLGACNNLAVLLDNARGGPKDKVKAKELFKKACDGGVQLACKNMK